MTKNMGRILIVEDDLDMQKLLLHSFMMEGFTCDVASSVKEFHAQIEFRKFNIILMDLQLGSENCLKMIPDIVRKLPSVQLVVMTAFGSIELAVDSMRKGAATFISKSSGIDKIIDDVKARIQPDSTFEGSNADKIAETIGIVGKSRAILSVVEQIDQLKEVDSTILVLGESGTGKELVARGLHKLSARKDHPFEAINCAAIPENLLESELFGHLKGSFTDAKQDRKGSFEICSDGTLFLDEIGEIPLSLQVKLLRVLQEKEIKPLGATRTRKVNTRIVCATNKDLEKLIQLGQFREDLYFRLSVFPIELPPLRKRSDDIPHLIMYYLDKMNKRYSKNVEPPSRKLLDTLSQFSWPGNIRQLQNSIERAVVLARDGELKEENFNLKRKPDRQNLSDSDDTLVYKEAKEAFERGFLLKLLSMTNGNVSEAARISGRFRSDIYRLMEKYGINKSNYESFG